MESVAATEASSPEAASVRSAVEAVRSTWLGPATVPSARDLPDDGLTFPLVSAVLEGAPSDRAPVALSIATTLELIRCGLGEHRQLRDGPEQSAEEVQLRNARILLGDHFLSAGMQRIPSLRPDLRECLFEALAAAGGKGLSDEPAVGGPRPGDASPTPYDEVLLRYGLDLARRLRYPRAVGPISNGPGSRTGRAEPGDEVEALVARALTSSDGSAASVVLHLLRNGGKGLRPRLVALAASCGRRPEAPVEQAAAAVEVLHVATLYHDDVMDDASTRRNLPTVNKMFGPRSAAWAGDLLVGVGGSLCSQLGSAPTGYYVDAVQNLIRGQSLELIGCPDGVEALDHYHRVVRGKTGALTRLAVELGALVGDCTPSVRRDLASIGELLGHGYQMLDDILDVVGSADAGKACGSDLRAGVRSLPLLIAEQHRVDLGVLPAVVGRPLSDDREVEQVLAVLRRPEVLFPALDLVDEVRDRAGGLVAGLGTGSAPRHALGQLLEGVMSTEPLRGRVGERAGS